MTINQEGYFQILENQVYQRILQEVNDKTADDIVYRLSKFHLEEKTSSSFQRYYFKTLNNEQKYLADNFFKVFKSKYSLQGISNDYLERLENEKQQILQLIRNNSLTKLYLDYFYKAKIKHKDSFREKSLGSFFAKLVHHFQPELYCALDQPIKNYLGLEKESFVVAFLVVSSEYKRWAENHKDLLKLLRNKFQENDRNNVFDFDKLTDIKLLDLIFWTKANRS